jgi:hypothetical protein
VADTDGTLETVMFNEMIKKALDVVKIELFSQGEFY